MSNKLIRRIKIASIVIGLILSAAVFVASSIGLLPKFWDTPSYGDVSPIVSIEIETIDRTPITGSKSTFVTTSDPAVIAKIVSTLNSGTGIADCRCLWSGYLRLTPETGPVIEVQLVPGHGESTYDIRDGRDRYSIDRDAMASALKGAGAKLPTFE